MFYTSPKHSFFSYRFVKIFFALDTHLIICNNIFLDLRSLGAWTKYFEYTLKASGRVRGVLHTSESKHQGGNILPFTVQTRPDLSDVVYTRVPGVSKARSTRMKRFGGLSRKQKKIVKAKQRRERKSEKDN